MSTLKTQVDDIAAITNNLVFKVEEKERRLVFMESVVNDLHTQMEESNARAKDDSFKIWAEFDTLRGAAEPHPSLAAGASTLSVGREGSISGGGPELIGKIPKNDLHVSGTFGCIYARDTYQFR